MNYNFTTSSDPVLDKYPSNNEVGLQRDVKYGTVLLQFIEEHKNEDIAAEFKKLKQFFIEINYLHDIDRKYKKEDQVKVFNISYFYEKYMLMMIYLNRPEIPEINNIFLKTYNPLITKNAIACYEYVKMNNIVEYDEEDMCSLVQTDFLEILHKKFIPILPEVITPFAFFMKQHLWWLPFSKLQKITKTRINKGAMKNHLDNKQHKIIKQTQKDNMFLSYLKLLRKFAVKNLHINKLEDFEKEEALNNVLLTAKFIEGRSVSRIKDILKLKTNTKIYLISKQLTTEIKDKAIKIFSGHH